MPYTMKNLPDWLKNLPKGVQELGIKVFNDIFAKTKDDDKARKAAWGAIKNKYHKDKDGKWVKKEEVDDMPNKKEIIIEDEQLNEIEDTFYAPCVIEQRGKEIFIRGLFVEMDTENENERIYPKSVVEKIVAQIKEKIKIGKDSHWGSGYRDVALKFKDAWIEGKGGFCRAKIIDTAAGKDLQIIAKEKIPIGLSMRGRGDQKYDKKLKASVVQDNYVLSGIDAVLEPAFEKAQALQEQKQKKEENVDELKKLIESFTTEIKGFNERIEKLETAGPNTKLSAEDQKVIAELKQKINKADKLKEAKARVVEILESDELKDYKWKETLNRHLNKCETVDEVNSTYPKVKETIKEMEGKKTKPEPTGVVITDLSHSFFGDKKIPNTIDEAYKYCLDKFDDTGIYKGKSRLNNPRYLASIMLDNYLKHYIGEFSEVAADAMGHREVFKRSRRNPLFHLTTEAVGDAEMYTGDVAQTAAYLLPLYVTIMQDMMNIVNQAVGILPLPKPTGKIPFKKTYYGDGAGGWDEINQANFLRTQAAKGEGVAPQLMKIKTLTNDITLETALKLFYEWTIEAEQDLRAYYGLNIDSDTLQEARKEIMRELSEQILYALLIATSFSNSDNCVQATGSPLTYNLANPAGYSKAEWAKFGLTKAVKQADALINKQPHNVKADTIIVDAAYDYLFTEPAFVAEDKILTNFGFNRIGTYQAHYKVFTTTCVDYAGKILLTHRGSGITEAAHLFMPYILFWIGGKVEQSTAEFSRTVISRFANKKVYGQKIAKINIV